MLIRTTRLHPQTLHPTRRRFNCSLIERDGEAILAYRVGWNRPRVHLAGLGRDWRITWTRPLEFIHPRCPAGVEDPRLFHHDGQLYLSLTGVESVKGQLNTHQLLTRLNDHLEPADELWSPQYARRVWPMEKNWQYFSFAGELFIVYSISPHLVLHVHDGHAYPFARTDKPLPWSGGYLRGGAPPVRFGEEFYCFFHGAVKGTRAEGPKRVYNIGVYTFEARPPFAVQRITPDPILWPNDGDRPADCESSVLFPCGAVNGWDRWIVSAGMHDTDCVIFEFDAAAIEERLQVVQ